MAPAEATAKSRTSKGKVVRSPTKEGVVFAARFTAYGVRRYVTFGSEQDGWNEHRAEKELARILGDVRESKWTPRDPVAAEPEAPPTFHAFASEWFEDNRHGWREATVLDYQWQLKVHLLPFFSEHTLPDITIAEVDRYRQAKLSESRAIEGAAAAGKPRTRVYTDAAGRRQSRPERPLGATSINKTITRLGQILETAVERDLIVRNPVRVNPRKRKAPVKQPDRVFLDRAEQIEALLDAAGEMDRAAKSNGRMERRALLSALVFSGLRISEALDLRWRDADLVGARLKVRQSKTDAGVRQVDLWLPGSTRSRLHDELSALKDRAPVTAPLSPVFPSAAGTRQDRNRVRNRVLAPAIDKANERLEADGHAPLPEGLTLHALRRTYCSVLSALTGDLAYVMDQMGHTDPGITTIYRKTVAMRPDDRDRLRAYVEDE